MNLDLSRIRAILFDLDGTLADTDDMLVQHLANLLRPLSFLFPNYNHQTSARRIIMSAEGFINWIHSLLGRLGLDEAAAPVVDYFHRLRGEESPGHLMLIPGIDAMLESLHSRYPLAIVTARNHRSAHAFLKQHRLLSYFQVVTCAQTCSRTKPHPMPILWAARQLNIPSASCLMVGDSANDIRAGGAAGAQTVGVLCGFGQRAELNRSGANLILDSTADLADLLLGPSSNSC